MTNSEISSNHSLVLILKEWRLFAALSLGFCVLGVIFYFSTKGYVGTSRILINDSQNNTLAATSQSLSGVARSIVDGKKGNSRLLNQIELLKSYQFFEQFKKMEISSDESLHPSQLKSKTQFLLESDFILKVNVQASTIETANYLTTLVSEKAIQQLKDREQKESEELIAILKARRLAVQSDLNSIHETLKKEKVDTDLILAPRSSERIGDYLTDLKIRIQESTLELNENLAQLNNFEKGLKRSTRGSRESFSQSYGIGGKIQDLRSKISEIRQKLVALKNTQKEWTSSQSDLSQNVAKVEEAKAQYKANLNELSSLTQAINKIDLQNASNSNRFQLLEPSRLESVKPRFSLWTIFAVALLTAQIIGSLIIYVKRVLKPSLANQNSPLSERNTSSPVVNNNGGFYIEDARFYFDNGQLRFRADVLDEELNIGRISKRT